eukprot:m.67907 g.67907  ORF g.67907 m.67907 type:complete len:154 (-) comp11918_c0_seq1:155-616(-)
MSKPKWNTMGHLHIKRFAVSELTPGAKRSHAQHPYEVLVELDPSGRSLCKLCGEKICKGSCRVGLMMQCHKGYKNLCTLHMNCFFKHPESSKLSDSKEFCFRPGVSETDKELVLSVLRSESNKPTIKKEKNGKRKQDSVPATRKQSKVKIEHS